MNLDNQTLRDHGFVILNNFFEKSKLQPIHSDFQAILSDLYGNNLPQNADEAEPWIAIKSQLQRAKSILALINNDIASYLKDHLNFEIELVKSCQIAARFPGEGIDTQPWHIDNFTEKDLKRSFKPKEFDLLVGIYLTDNQTENAGNFTCYPGGHHQTRAYSRCINSDINLVYDHFRSEGLDPIRSQLKLASSFQVKAGYGSVLIADRMLPHLICAPNLSDQTRIIIFFRTRFKHHNLSNLFFGTGPKNDLGNQIELAGLGYQKSETIYRIKPRLKQHLPNAIASMVEIKFNQMLISIHSSGFLSKMSHNKWLDKLRNQSLLEIVEAINDVNYEFLIEEWYPMSEPVGELKSVKIEFHHIHSASKSAMIRSWHPAVEVSIGQPGLITFTLQETVAQVLISRILALHWNRKPKIFINDVIV